MTTAVSPKAHQLLAVKCTEALLKELKQASSFVETKAAIEKYITNLDGTSECGDSPCVLGDQDMARLFMQSLRRRGKSMEIGIVMMTIESEYEGDRLVEELEKRMAACLI